MPLTSLVLLLLISMLGCQSDTPAAAKKTASEDELIDRLSVELVSQPRSQAEIDRNLIINYAIDSLLDVRSTASGLYYYIERPGEGEPLKAGEKITAHYHGRLLNGQVFDSSYKKGKPLHFGLEQVIPGWQEGIPMILPGGKVTLLVPSHLAYGARGFPGFVPPNTVLRFEIELLASK